MFDYLLIPITMVVLLLTLAAPIIIVYLFFRLTAEAFVQVGFSHWHAILMVFGSLVGSSVNIPLHGGTITSYPPLFMQIATQLSSITGVSFASGFHPVALAINMGGCIIPVVVSLAILIKCQVSTSRAILGTLIVAMVTYRMAMPVANEGILLPVYVSPTLAAVCGLVLARRFQAAPALAYISGTVGTLLGADIFSLLTPGVLAQMAPPEPNAPSLTLSIGGAGVIDGIFLTGIIAVLLAALVVHISHPNYSGPLKCAED